MDKFLEIVYTSQIGDRERGDTFEIMYKPLTDKLKSVVSPEVYKELETLFIDCSVENARFYAVEGMKLAIGIMDGSYIPTF